MTFEEHFEEHLKLYMQRAAMKFHISANDNSFFILFFD